MKGYPLKRRNKVPEEGRREKQETLRAENRKLRKEVQQLRKQLDRISHRDADVKDMLEYIESPEHKEDLLDKEEKFECPHCYSTDTKVLDLGHKHYYSCNSCGQKGPLK